ncbi:MAG: dehydrogenase, partial [Saprospiraceae bacterium]|nr:dehydrogenase [Saprospiraceae bacterium]
MIFISRLYPYWLAIITVSQALFLSSCLQEHVKTSEFQLEDGLEVYEIACEPLIYDPVAFVCDELGAMYVVEHRGYPDPAEGGKPATREGSIALIQDTNHDGIYDKRCDFVTGLTYPNGVLAWKGGIFVTCAPDIFYFKDTTGDGIADIRETVLTGFFDTKTAQIRMSHPTMGLDGLIYITGGLNGGSVTSPRYPERPAVSYKSSDGRFDPESLVFETVSGRSQFGLTFDAFGRRFGCSNRHPVMQAVLEPGYLNRNPHVLYNETIQNVSKVQSEAVVYPISGAAITADFIPSLIGRSHQGTFTSASGIFVLSDESLGSDHLGNFFICESAQSMVQRQVVSPYGPTFQSQIAQDGVEFLASKHEWFRPVFLGIGSSPGLYVVDMHRKVIDHPSYVPESMRDQLDFQSGRDMGRIYRIVKKGIKSKPIPAFDDNQEIVELLNSSSEWMRVTAFRLLLEKTPETVAPALHEIAVGGNLPQSRVRAIWMLHHLGELDLETLAEVVKDPISGVREQAIR